MKASVFAICGCIPLSFLAGCTSIQTLTTSENSVSYEYNVHDHGSAEVVAQATADCGKFGKKPELKSRTHSPSGNWTTDIFDCK